MSTNLSLHGQERLQDTISWYAPGAEKHPSRSHAQVHNSTNTLTEWRRVCFVLFVMQHNPRTVNMRLDIIIKLNHLLKQFASYAAIQRPALSRCSQTHNRYLWITAWWIPSQLGCNKTIQHKCNNDFPHFNHMEIQSNTATFQQYGISTAASGKMGSQVNNTM